MLTISRGETLAISAHVLAEEENFQVTEQRICSKERSEILLVRLVGQSLGP